MSRLYSILWLICIHSAIMWASIQATPSPGVKEFSAEEPDCSRLKKLKTESIFSTKERNAPPLDCEIHIKSFSNNEKDNNYLELPSYKWVTLNMEEEAYTKYFILITGFNADVDQFTGTAKRLVQLARGNQKQYHYILIISAYSGILNYIQAVRQVIPVADFVYRLIHRNPMLKRDLARVHIIGHSLGAHIGHSLGVQNGHKLERITGLDPAKPGFENVDDRDRLAPSDATFVDVIHTDACLFGMSRPVGHADFYPDGAQEISLCPSGMAGISMDQLKHLGRRGHGVECRHMVAIWLYTESIAPTIKGNKMINNWEARECDTWLNFRRYTCADSANNTLGYRATKPQQNGYNKFYLFLKHGHRASYTPLADSRSSYVEYLIRTLRIPLKLENISTTSFA